MEIDIDNSFLHISTYFNLFQLFILKYKLIDKIKFMANNNYLIDLSKLTEGEHY